MEEVQWSASLYGRFAIGEWAPVPIVREAGWVPALVWTRYYEFIKAGNQKKSNGKLEESFEAGKGTPNNL